MRSFLHRLAFLLPVALAAVLAVFPLHNDDAGFHLATGRTILQLGHVPQENPFTYANDGARWTQHQWLPAVAMAQIVAHFGVSGLVLAKALAVALAFAMAAWTMARQSVPPAVAAAWLTLGVAASAFRFYERPYLASILALALVVAGLWRWWQSAWRPGLWLAALTPVVAVHLHAGALDGVLVWLAALGAATLDGLLGQGWQRARLLLPVFLTMLIATALGLWLFAPSGLALLTLPLSFSGNAYWHAHLAEFRPLALNREALLQWPFVLAAAAVLVLALRRRHWFAALLLAGFLALGLRHVRMIWPLVVVALPVAAELSAPFLNRPRLCRLLPVIAVVFGLAATVEQHATFGLGLGRDGIDHHRHPLALLQRAARLPQQAFVSDGFAGTWLWQVFVLPDQHRVLVHNCLECYKEETYRDAYQKIRYGEPGWQALVVRYGIRTFVLKYTTPGERAFQNGAPNIRQLLFADPAWLLVDFDDAGAIYTARDGLPAGEATLDGFPVDPDTGRARGNVAEATLVAALRAHAAAHPHDTRALDMLARRLARAGQAAEANAVAAEMARRAAEP